MAALDYDQLVSWHCVGSGPRLRFALGIERGGKVSEITAEVWRDTTTGAWPWKAGPRTGCEPTREYAARAAEAALSS
jgi:hypothetical protein